MVGVFLFVCKNFLPHLLRLYKINNSVKGVTETILYGVTHTSYFLHCKGTNNF